MYHATVDNFYLVPDGRGSRDEHLPRRDPRREGFPGEDDRLHPVLPPRGRVVRQGRARTQPPAPVRQGGDRAAARCPKRATRHWTAWWPTWRAIVKALGLPYRILRLCGGDMSFTSALTYDFEVYSEAAETLAGSVVGIELRVVPGQPPQTPLPRRGARKSSWRTPSTARRWPCRASWPRCWRTTRPPKASSSPRR